MAEPLQQLRAAVVQSAETARLMGVDFIPVYATGVLGIDLAAMAPEPDASAAAPAALPPQTPAPTGLPAAKTPEPLRTPASPATRPTMPPAAAPAAKPSAPTKPAAAPSAKPSKLPEAPKPGVPIVIADSVAGYDSVNAKVAAARSLEERGEAMARLRAAYEQQSPHASFSHATRLVWGEGELDAKVLLIGDAPVEVEEREGRPFLGPSGELLDKMLAAMKVGRGKCYLTNLVKARPTDDRTLQESEVAASIPFLMEQIAIIGPDVIIALGVMPARVLLRTTAKMSELRGVWSTLTLKDGRDIAVMPTFAPSYVLNSYTDEVRGKVWSDLQLVMERLGVKRV